MTIQEAYAACAAHWPEDVVALSHNVNPTGERCVLVHDDQAGVNEHFSDPTWEEVLTEAGVIIHETITPLQVARLEQELRRG